jgi:hypothetical protein
MEEKMTEGKLADILQSLVMCNCVDVDEEDRCFARVEEVMTIEYSPYSTTVPEKGIYLTMPNGQRFLVYVKEN